MYTLLQFLCLKNTNNCLFEVEPKVYDTLIHVIELSISKNSTKGLFVWPGIYPGIVPANQTLYKLDNQSG